MLCQYLVRDFEKINVAEIVDQSGVLSFSVRTNDMKTRISPHSSVFWLNLETGMERDEDGVVLGSTRLSSSQRLHR